MLFVRQIISGGVLAMLLGFGLPAEAQTAITAEVLPSPASPEATSQNWRFIIVGNQSVPEAQLLAAAREDLDLFRSQGHAASAIDDAAFQMELLYRHAGFATAVVDYEIDAETRQAHFQVQEGARLMVKALDFQGNQSLERARLLGLDAAIMEALGRKQPFPYVADTINTLAGNIRNLYITEGYLQAKVQAAKAELAQDEPISLTVVIEEGPRFMVGEVTVHGDIPPGLGPQVAGIVNAMQGAVYQRRQKLVLKTRLHDCYENSGYADVLITISEELDDKRGLVRLFANVDSGKPVVVDEVRITGNERTSSAFIQSRLHLEPGTQYRLDDKQDSFSRLYQTGLFSYVDLTLTDGTDPGHKTVLVKVEERKAREVYLEPGWGSYELLRLKSGYKDSNIFGSGRILRFDSALSTMGRSLEVGVSDPWFLGSDITVGLPFHYRYRTEPAFTMENSGADLYLLKTIRKTVTVNLGYQYSKNVVTDVGPDADLLGLASNYHTASLTGQLTRDTRDDMFFPTSGYRGNVSLAIARPDFGGTIAYNRLLTGVRYFLPLSGASIVGLRFNTGVILPTGDQQSIPVAERFFNGGERSVRSFQASQLGPLDTNGDPLGGAAFSTYNIEWRKKFTENLAWSLFFDLGNVSPNVSQVDGQSPFLLDADTLIESTWQDYFSDFRSGVGTGVQYMLPVGPARLDLALNPDRDAARNEADYVVHFSIGMAF